ncbi:MFS general substrate transporter, partial [Hanseniaspora valbyensis NRRL Y-1626]
SVSMLEHNLTYHVRKTFTKIHSSTASQQRYCLSLVSSLAAGSVMIISLYSSTWLTLLNYNSFQINLISSAINIGAYMVPPILGAICDTHGPVTLSLISFFSFVPHYYIMSRIGSIPISEVKHFSIMIYCCAMIGCGTSSLYFASLISCARFFKESKMMSVSMPTTLYGCGSVLFAYVVTHWKKFKLIPKDKVEFNSDTTFLNLQQVFKYMALFYFIVIVLNYVATAIVTHLKLEYEEELEEVEVAEERNPLLHRDNTNYEAITNTLTNKLQRFIRNKKTVLLFLIVFLSIGCLETFISNMAAISELYSSDKLIYSPQIALSNFSIFSTCIRFVVGMVVDLSAKKYGKHSKNVDIYLMICLLILGLISQTVMYLSNSYLNILSGVMGISYGGLFTIFPIITLNHYDDSIFAIAYGCFLLAPAAGTPLFSLVFAKIFDKNQCLISWFSFSCINSIFLITSGAFAFCLLLSVGITIFGRNK